MTEAIPAELRAFVVERVRADGYFQKQVRRLLERDTRIVDALAPPKKPKGSHGGRG